MTEFALLDKLHFLNNPDPYLLELKRQLREDSSSLPQFSFQEGLLFFCNRLVIPPAPDIRHLLLHEFHSSKLGSHSGIARTFHRLSSNFYWKGMRADVKLFVQECQICQQMKDSSLKPAGLLQPLPLSSAIFDEISMDFITGLPSSNGRTAILVIVD